MRAAGYKDGKIRLLVKDASDKAVKTDGAGDTNAGEGAATGAAIGVGGLAGVIPVIGPILALGTLGTVLLNAAIAGLAGALVGWGIPEHDARITRARSRPAGSW